MEPKKRPAAIDWRAVHRRLDAARAATERAWMPNAEETERTLKARAQALAREPGKAQAADALEIVEFVLAHERYGAETSFVREIHPLTNLTPLPCTPAFVLGVVNLRGEIVSVIDIKKFFELPEKGLTDLNKVVVLQSATMRFGVLADAVLGVRRVPVAEIQPSLPTLTGIREQYLKGVTSERTIVLDAEKLLKDESIVVQEEVER
ncbi:MAG: purine-binding chemotaxis protein CheW [Betaproteobacteria bacterium]|nr:MAG: purine-binding chemotaxis protein CheW [Betaproteobacteria bacterium]